MAMPGPLKGLRLLFANMIPGLAGGAMPNAAPPSLTGRMPMEGAPARTRRMLEGKVVEVGVAGRTLTLLCGLLALWWLVTLGEAMETLEVEEALLWVWWWCGMLRMLLTEEEVDLRPRRPPDERR